MDDLFATVEPTALDRLDRIEPVASASGGDAIELAARDVHIWYSFYEQFRDPALVAACEALLTADERARKARFVFDRDRHRYLMTRALIRTVLSRYAPARPADWRFVTNDYGRPQISAPDGVLWPQFNLSKTSGMIVCALTTGFAALGIDVEDQTRMTDSTGIADRFFAPAEVRALLARPRSQQDDRFFTYWTLKESYIKARGMGLSIPLEQFAFDVDSGAAIAISFDHRLPDDPSAWRFARLRGSPRHQIAVAVRCQGGPPPLLKAAEWRPPA